MVDYAEVIGDPVSQSKSPIIHRYWLDRLGAKGDYIRTQVASNELSDFLAGRRVDPAWRGCNVTIPHKTAVIQLLDRLDPAAAAIGAVNCIIPKDKQLIGFNTDIDGVACALNPVELEGRKVAVIGAGGGARAVVSYLAARAAGRIVLVVRSSRDSEALRALAPDVHLDVLPLEDADRAFAGAAAIINATPLGMLGASPMPQKLIGAVGRHAAEATLFDMVTTPVATPFLAAGLNSATQVIDGLTMLIGQARRGFELFFGAAPPRGDDELRNLLTTLSPDSG